MLDYIKLYPETFSLISRYDITDRYFLIEAFANLAFYGNEPEWEQADRKWFVWPALQNLVNMSVQARERQARASRENGMKGGRPPKTNPVSGKPGQTQETYSVSEEPHQTRISHAESDTESDNDTDSDIESERETKPVFHPPTLEEVTVYIRENGCNVNPEKFFAHYESNGWRVGQNPMRDWKAAIRHWHLTEKDQPQRRQPQRTVTAQQYEQRDYSQEPAQPLSDEIRESIEKAQATLPNREGYGITPTMQREMLALQHQ